MIFSVALSGTTVVSATSLAQAMNLLSREEWSGDRPLTAVFSIGFSIMIEVQMTNR